MEDSESLKQDHKLLSKRIEELENEVREWRRKRETLNNQVIELAKKRNSLNIEVKEAIKIARENRDIRDKKNEIISAYKAERNSLQEQISQFSEKLDKIEKKISELPPETLKRSYDRNSHRLKKQVQQLEWKIQTTSNLPLDEERALVARISELEDQLSQQEDVEDVFRDRKYCSNKLRSLKNQLRAVTAKMGREIAESRVAHKKMIEMYKDANKYRKDADVFHNEIQEIKSDADKVHQQYVERIKQKRKLDAKMRAIRATKTAQIEQLAAERVEKAKTAIKDGKKISFDEFKTMIDQGLI
ncbi:MAG: coiled-coil protein [Candidatus Hodarchaeales archaeon]